MLTQYILYTKNENELAHTSVFARVRERGHELGVYVWEVNKKLSLGSITVTGTK